LATRRLFDGAQIELGILPIATLGVSSITGVGSITLGSLTGVSNATLSISGTGSVTLGSLTGSGTGVLGSTITGTGSVTLGALTGSGTGSVSISGTASVNLGSLTSTATGALQIKGQGSVTLGSLTGSGTGILGTPPITGTGSVTLGALTGSGTGTLTTVTGPCPTAQEIAQEVWNYILEGSVSAGQMLRGVTRTQLARVDINETTGQVTIYKLDGTTVFAQASTSPTGDRNTPTVDWT
jgi:hypothetical protein